MKEALPENHQHHVDNRARFHGFYHGVFFREGKPQPNRKKQELKRLQVKVKQETQQGQEFWRKQLQEAG